MRKVITALLYLCIYMTVIGSLDLYPPSWNAFCDVFNSTEFINITCDLKPEHSQRLQLYDLNQYTNNTADNVKYSVNWNCSPNASVSMRLPMQINKLYSLKVSGCRIFEYYDDWNLQSLGKIKDSRVYEEFVDCVTMVDIIQHLLFLTNFQNVSNDWMCGPDTTIRQSISRNISLLILGPDMNGHEPLTYFNNINFMKRLMNLTNLNSSAIPDLIGDYKTLLRNYRPQCDFQNLEVLVDVMNEALHDTTIEMLFQSAKDQYPNMRVFNFSRNGYTSFLEDWDDNMDRFPKLEYIDYSYNYIADIWNVNSLSDTQPGRQVELDLSYNNITTLTTETVSKWTTFPDVTVNIRGNPLDCGCFKQDFIFKVQDDKFFEGKMQKYKYLQHMKCATPASAQGIKLINLSKAEMGCDIPEDLTIYLVVIGVTAAIYLGIILVFVYRKEIKLLLYVNFNILLPWDVDKSVEQKRFDAFISYSSSNSDWVLDTLIHKLESPFDSHDVLSLCIHERDFIAGKSILLNIIDSIENSRHTIVVLSRQFMQNVWTMAEFKEAYEESVTKKRRHLIIIKYEDIPEAEMDSMLKRCIKTFTYIDVKDPRFLDRLRFSLAIKSR